MSLGSLERRIVLAGALLLLAGGPAQADDDVTAGLLHPLEAHRRAAEQALAERDDAGPILETLIAAENPRLRATGWRVIAKREAARFTARAIESLSDPSASVGVEAGRALLKILASETHYTAPRVPSGELDTAARTALAHGLAEVLEDAPATELPTVVYRVGDGVLPCLHEIAGGAHFRTGARRSALELIARIGGEAAREALVDLVEPDWDELTPDVLRALTEVGFGAYGDHLYWTLRGGSDTELPISWRDFLRMRFRERGIVLRCIVHAPPRDAGGLRDHLRALIERRRYHPSRLVEIVRALLALGPPTDDDLVMIVEAVGSTRSRRHPRSAEMGYALAALLPFKDRVALQDTARSLLERRDLLDESRFWQTSLPETVEAWCQFYIHGTADEPTARDVCDMATHLIRGDGEVPTYASRRLGVRLWSAMAKHAQPSRGLVTSLLRDDDSWVQRHALRWLDRVEPDEASAAVSNGLRATEIDSVLAAAETDVVPLSAAVQSRLLALSVEGHRWQRARAWRVLRSCVADAGDDAVSATAPVTLDERLRAAAELYVALDLALLEASDEGLRKPAGR